MALREALEALAAALEAERTESGLLIALRVLESLRLRADHLRKPLTSAVERLAKHESVAESVREMARQCSRQWQAVLKGTPLVDATTPNRGGKREKHFQKLVQSMSQVVSCHEVLTELEAMLFNLAASTPGRSADKMQNYVDRLEGTCRALARSPMLQALTVVRALPLDAIVGAGVGAPCSEAEWLRRAIYGGDKLRAAHGTRQATASSSRVDASMRRELLADMARRRKVQANAPAMPAPSAREYAEVSDILLLNVISLLLPHIEPLIWCRMASICHGMAACVTDGSLWVEAYKRRWQDDSNNITIANAYDEYRRRHVLSSTTVVNTLRRALRAAQMGTVERYLRWGFPVNTRMGGSHMLLLAMRAGHWHVAEALLVRHGADALCTERSTGDGPLHIAAQDGAKEMIQTLMLYGALPGIDARNRYHHTPLHVAVHERHVQVVRMLLEFGANPCLRFDGITVVEMAAETKHAGLMRLLGEAFSKWQAERGMEASDDESGEDGGTSEESSEDCSIDSGSQSDTNLQEDQEEEAKRHLAAYRAAIRRL